MKVLKWLDRHLEECLMVILMCTIVLVMTYQIIRRYIFNSSLSWSEELCRYCFVWFMFLAFSYSIRIKKYLKMDAIVNIFPQKIKNLIYLITLILSLMVVFYLFIYSFDMLKSIRVSGEKSTALGIPMTYVYGAVVFGMGMSGFRFLQRIVLDTREKKGE